MTQTELTTSTETSSPASHKKSLTAMDSLINFLLKYGMLLAILFLIVFFALNTDYFLSIDNFMDIFRSVSILVIVATGVTMSTVVGGFDVSVGAVTGLAVILCPALMVIWRIQWIPAVLITLTIGTLIGLFNAFLVNKIRIPDLLATLAVMYIVNGVQMNITKGDSVYKGMTNPWSPDRVLTKGAIEAPFLKIGQGFIYQTEGFRGIPIPVIVMLVIVIVAGLYLAYTRFGRSMYAVGGNLEAARLSGINVMRYRTVGYALSALLATIGGLVLASRIGSGAVKAGEPFLLDAVAATYFGFAVLGARKPNVFGTMMGALFVGIMLNGLTMMNMPWYLQDVIKGLVLLISLGLSFYLTKKK